MNYLVSIELIRTIPCLAEPGKLIVVGKPSSSLKEIIPYLATLLGVLAFNPRQSSLTFRRPRGFMTIENEIVYFTQVSDVSQGLELLACLTESINAVWQHRAELIPITAAKRAPRLLDIWILLPNTNCKQCGEATCLVFTVGLILHKRQLRDCPEFISKPGSLERLSSLKAVI